MSGASTKYCMHTPFAVYDIQLYDDSGVTRAEVLYNYMHLIIDHRPQYANYCVR